MRMAIYQQILRFCTWKGASPPPDRRFDHEPDREPLCDDVPIGYVVKRFKIPVFLSVNVDFLWRDERYESAVGASTARHRIRGPMHELVVELRVRPFTRHRKPTRYVYGFGDYSLRAGGWPIDRFRPAPGVILYDVVNLCGISDAYNRNLSARDPSDVKLIPHGIVREIRDITSRLTAAATGNTPTIVGDTT